MLVIIILFLLFCRRRGRGNRVDSDIPEKLEIEPVNPSQIAINKRNDPKSPGGAFPTVQKGGDVPTSSAPVQAIGGSYVASGKTLLPSILSSDLQRKQTITSPPTNPANASTDISEAPPRPVQLPSGYGDVELALTSAIERPSGYSDVELALTSAIERMSTGSMLHADTALIPTPTVEKLNDWTEASKVVFSIDIGTSHSVRSFYW